MDALHKRVAKLTSILDVARAMTEERDLDRLLHIIVDEVRDVMECERASLFILDRERNELWSKVALGSEEIRFPADQGIAGDVARTGTLSNIADAYEDPRFNRRIDQETGFRTASMLTVPMRNTAGDVVGVLQALNKHGADGAAAFTSEDEELLLALAGVAGAALTNALLHDEIERLFEGFAQASVVAIESRDPTTAGHSGRVAHVTCGLAEAVQKLRTGRWGGLQFSRDQMRELRYAALLHDFGKVGVREHVLVKAEKLYPGDLETLRTRFEAIRQHLRAESAQRKAELALAGGPGLAAALSHEDAALAEQLREVDLALELVLAANRPTVLESGSFEKLHEVARRTWTDSRGQTREWLTRAELALLSIRRGSLAERERLEIESHVEHTFRFLSQIPWTRSLRGVPEIARGHHEKLSGRGYPQGLGADDIPVQTRMITISDIYDALTASDRPYKRAVPHEKALQILEQESREGHVDADLLRVFIEADVGRTARGSQL